jgi:chromate transporter
MSTTMLAGDGNGAMQRDYAGHSARCQTLLDAPEAIGRLAGERAAARIGTGRIDSGAMPVVFDRRLSAGLVGRGPRHPLTPEAFANLVSIAQVTPGPIGINSATYVGYSAVVNAGYSHAVGILGSTIATVSVVLPSFILMVLISKFFLKYQKHPIIASVFEGLRPGVVGLLAAAALVLMNGENFGTYNWQILTSIILFAGTFIASYRYKVNPILLIVICGIIGYVTFGYILTPQ